MYNILVLVIVITGILIAFVGNEEMIRKRDLSSYWFHIAIQSDLANACTVEIPIVKEYSFHDEHRNWGGVRRGSFRSYLINTQRSHETRSHRYIGRDEFNFMRFTHLP